MHGPGTLYAHTIARFQGTQLCAYLILNPKFENPKKGCGMSLQVGSQDTEGTAVPSTAPRGCSADSTVTAQNNYLDPNSDMSRNGASKSTPAAFADSHSEQIAKGWLHG